MLYICIFSNKFDLKQTKRVLHMRLSKSRSGIRSRLRFSVYQKEQFPHFRITDA